MLETRKNDHQSFFRSYWKISRKYSSVLTTQAIPF